MGLIDGRKLEHIKKRTYIAFRPGCVQHCMNGFVTILCSPFLNLSSTCTLLNFCLRVLLCNIGGRILEKYHRSI